MKKQYRVIVNTGKKADNKALEIEQNAGDSGRAVRIRAQAGAKYQLQELAQGTDFGPEHVKAYRNGKNLEITFEGGTEPDLIIEDYYVQMPGGYNGVIGQAPNGSYYEYC